jgi:lysophospholipase L1-like esterase
MSWLAIAAIAAAGVLVLAELAARAAGFHRPLLYERTEYGYRVAPSQQVRIFGRVSTYNAFGTRGGETTRAPAPGEVRILCLGDSITNGGVQTSDPDTWPAQLERILASHMLRKRVEVMNASAGGWALENELGWLRAHGTFGAHVVVLQVATHDMFQRMATSRLVGLRPGFPDRYPALGIFYALRRYVLPRFGLAPSTRDPGEEPDAYEPADVERSVQVLEHIRSFAGERAARLIVLHVEQPSALEPRTALVEGAIRALEAWAARAGVTLIRSADAMRTQGDRLLFRDAIHPNPAGNRVLATEVAAVLAPLIVQMR